MGSYRYSSVLLAISRCIVTGGDSGIGKAAAVAFAMEGADVAIVYLPEEQVDANNVQKTIQSYGRECLLIPQDLRSEEGCKRVVDVVVKAWGRIDVLVNNSSVSIMENSLHCEAILTWFDIHLVRSCTIPRESKTFQPSNS
jgi:NAD(P)-dependent dehydrogenase (short-subunit alcohol dehydrogenase family)